MLQHCLTTDPKDALTIIEAELIMQHKDGLLEDLSCAIEELERAAMFLEIARAVVDTPLPTDSCTKAQWSSLLLSQALLVNETATDFLRAWPDRLDAQSIPL